MRADTYEAWQPPTLPATWQIDLGTTVDIDYGGIAGHTLGSSGVATKMETSADASSWSSLSSEFIPEDDSPLVFLDATRSHRHVRISMTGAGSMPKLASIYIGKSLTVQRGVQPGFRPPNLSRKFVLENAMSKGGQFLNQNIRRRGVETNPQFKFLDEDWYRTFFDPFVIEAAKFPFFFAWNPQYRPREVAYAWSGQPIMPSYHTSTHFQVGLDLVGIGYI
jgi:hypothetical protein